MFLSKRYLNKKGVVIAEIDGLNETYDDLIDLSVGEHDIITDEHVMDRAFLDGRIGHTKYTDPLGDKALIKEVVKLYENTKEENVMVTAGASHGLYLALEAIIDKGDEVIIFEPAFTAYKDQIELVGGKCVSVSTYEENNFNIDTNELLENITQKTKAILLNSPNNPTGAIYDRHILESILQVARLHNILVISDEVYSAFDYNNTFSSLLDIKGYEDMSMVVNSFSKNYAMTGWRVGYAIGPEYIINCMKNINEGVCYTPSSISQRAGIYALRNKARIENNIKELYEDRIDYVIKRIGDIKNIHGEKPEGSFYIFLNIKKTGFTSFEFCRKILKECHIRMIPGNVFGNCGEGFVRMCVSNNLDTLKECFDRIEKKFF
ncbi:aminotransferase class I/II-fold pyridoxal phosphate-dependent enzyme [Anaeromicrobium sediminis]|uniref:Aminotransferase n=1 Tax=Anaeromicrobium sediminis TaxID=1478221 RepID=A0A267MKV1_9FIRM|nr:aminotransferase class I/II-fold pyridoxal phosphate-dependent enzyme [Anaeromicrobium sediminis]PAB59548.1 hypothetical protein CCE28_10060 [Anaeromicrobium sediminis]